MKINSKHIIFFVALIITLISVASAADINDTTSSSDVTTSTTSLDTQQTDTNVITESNNNHEIKNTQQTTKNVVQTENSGQTRNTTPKVWNISNANFSNIVTSNGLNSEVNDCDILNFVSDVTRTGSSYIIDKPVTILGNQYTLNLNTGLNYAKTSLNFVNGASNSNITGLNLLNTQVYVNTSSNITFDNIHAKVNNSGVGAGVGSFAIRDGSINVTVKNSYFETYSNGGYSTLVLTWAKNCTIENNTVYGTGNVGNLVYLNNYGGKVNANGIVNNSGNTIKDNTITAVSPGMFCYALTITGANNSIINNIISNNRNYSVTTSWAGSYEETNPGDTHNVSYHGNKYINNTINGRFSTGNYSIVEGNWINGTSTIVGHANVTNNTFLGPITLNNNVRFHSNNATGQTVTVILSDSCFKNNKIGILTITGPYNTYDCGGNTIGIISVNLYKKYFKPCNGTCPNCDSTQNMILLKKSTKNFKTQNEGELVSQYSLYSDNDLMIYNNGTAIITLTNGLSEYYGNENPYSPKIDESSVEITDIIIYINYNPSFDYKVFNNPDNKNLKLVWNGSSLINKGFFISSNNFKSITYENFNINLNYPNSQSEVWESGSLILYGNNITLRNIRYTFTSKDIAPMANLASQTDNTGVSGAICIRGENILIENSEFTISQEQFINITELGLQDDFDDDFHDYGIFFYKSSNITFLNNTFSFDSMDKDSGIAPNKYSSIFGGKVNNLTLSDNKINVRYVPGIKVSTNNSQFENNEITVLHTDKTLELIGDNNLVRYNTLTAGEKEGDATVIVTGDNNIVEQNPKPEPKTIIVTQDNVEDVFSGEGHTLGVDVNPGDTLDFQGLIDKNHSLVINKPVTVVSTTKDAVIRLHTVAGSLMGDDPGNCFVINKGASGSYVSGLRLENTECWVYNLYNATLYNMTMYVKDARVGSGVGQTSLRFCNNVTMDSCHIYTENNGGSSSFVWTGCNNCTIINSTVQGEGSVGNLLYVGNAANLGVVPEGYVITNFDNKVINCTVLGGSGGISNPLQNGGVNTLIQGTKFYAGGSAGAGAWGTSGATITFANNEFYRTVSMTVAANSTAYGNVFYGTGSTTVQANAQVYNNTLNAVTISGADALFENNTVKGKLTVNQPTNVKDNNLADVQVGTNGKNSNITNNNVTGTITSGATNVVIDSNNITTTNDKTVVVTGANNTVTNNILYTRTKAGDETLNVKDDTTVEGNIPESGKEFELTDENYLKFFDTNGNLINTNVTNYSTLTFKGEFNDKVFKFDNIVLSLTGEEAVINNGYISTDNGAIVALENVVFNNTREGIPNSVLLNSDGNLVRNVTVYRTSNSGISREIMVNGDKNSILSNKFDLTIPVENIDYSEYPFAMSNASAISVTGSENIINSNIITVRNSTTGTGTISVIDLASRTKSSGNTVNSNTIVAESTGYLYGINLGSNTDANTINSNNIKLSSDVYTAGIQIGYSPAKDNTINSNTINLTSPIAYGVLASAYEGEITGTTVNSNKVYISANQGVGIELCGSNPETIKDATINSNTIVVDGNYCIGIAVSGSDIDVNENTITVTGRRNDTDETSYDIIKPTTSGIILYNSENIEALNNVITAENGANIILNGTSNSKVTRTTNNKKINTENAANIVLDNSNNNLIDNQIAYTTSEYAVILTNSSNNNITNNNLNASNINGGDAAISMDENSKDNYLYNNIPVFGVLTDETYSTFFDENSTYKFPEGINILSLGGDLHNKDLIFTNNITFVNAGNYTIYNGTIIVNDVEGSRYDDRFVRFNNININNTDKPVFIGNLSTDQQRNIEFRGGVFTVTGDNITAFESVHGPKTYTVLDIQYATVIMDGKDVTAFKMSRDEYTKNDYLDVEKSNITLKSTGKNTAFEVINTNLDILGNNITQTGSDVLTAYIENAYANGKFFGENNINASGEKVAILILNETQGNNPTIGNNNITATSPNPVPAITIITSKNSYVGQGQYTYSSYNYPNTIIINAENGEVPIVNIIGNGYVRNNFIMSNDLYGAEGVNATTISNITPTRTSINITAPEQAKVFDKITINVTTTNATTTSDGMIILKINDEIVANTTKTTLSYTYTANNNETLNIVAEYIYKHTGFVSGTANATVTLANFNDTLTLDANKPFLNENLTITGTLIDENNNPICNATITIDINGNKVNVTTDTEGKYNYTTTPIEGNNTITVKFDGNNSYISKEESKTVFVVDLEKYLQVDELNKTIQEQNKTIEELNKSNTDLKDKLQDANKQIDSLNKNITNLNNQIKELNNKNKDLQDKLTAANNKINTQEKQIKDLQDQLNKANDKVNTQEKQIKDLTDKLNNADKTIANQNKTIQDLNNQVSQLNNKIKNLTTKTNTKITVNKIATGKYASTVTINGTLTDANNKAINNGVVTIKLNTGTIKVVTNSKGIYAYKTTNAKVGTNNVTVTFTATDKYAASTAKTTFKLNKATPTLKINPISAVKFKDSVKITGSLIGANNKVISNANIILKINKKSVTVKTAKDGSFTYTTKATAMGTNNITATYNGNGNFNKVSKKVTFKVNKQSLILTVDRVASGLKFKDPLVVSGRLVDGNNKAVVNTMVSLKFNGKTYKAKTDKNGYYKVTTRATTMGKNNVTASYAGNTKYNKATAKTTFTVAKQDIIITFDKVSYNNGKVTISGTFTDRNRHALMNSLARITLNGKQGTAKTNNKGTFTYTTKAKQGTYKVTLAYPGNDRYNAYSKTSTVKTA